MITSTKNQKIINLRKLTQRKHRHSQKRFAVEGLQLLAMALEGGHKPFDVFYCEAQFNGEIAPALWQRLLEAGGHGHAISPKVMNSLSERDAPQGLIATFPLFEMPLNFFLRAIPDLDIPKLFIIVDRLQDPGNLGTIIRTADAVAASGVILVEPCVDPFDPKTVRGSMGSLFTMPLIRTTDPDTTLSTLHKCGYKLTGADGYQGDFPWADKSNALSGSVALCLGNEARGLSEDLRTYLTHWVRLPLLGKAESLNVAVAGGVLMYHWVAVNNTI